ncbi:lysophospholipid acyltransferase family protein [Pelagibacteraceae bacterium]|nr:lysophospholipid acyltransferase family protein [Pelagibacteraceae bacterium]
MKKNNIAFTFATAEVNRIGQLFIMITELLTGKLKLKKLYDEYLSENRPPQLFWDDAVTKLDLKLITNFKKNSYIPSKGKLIVIANHAFGVADGVSICSILSKVRQDYKMVTHKVLRQADAVKDKILPIDFNETKEALLTNINTRKEAEKVLLNDGVIVLFPSGRIATKKNLNKNTKADDGEWKQWVSKLILKTKSPVLPIFFDGQNSQWYHMANKLGLTFRYSLCMYELKRKIGDSINMYFGSIISYEDLAEIGDIKEITLHLRSVTYSLDPQLNNN